MFEDLPSKRAHKTTLLINREDWEFIKSHGYKPTNLLRKKISELRKKHAGESTDWEKAATTLREKLEKVCQSMADNMTPEQFKKIMAAA